MSDAHADLLWVSTSFATFGVVIDQQGNVRTAAPIARWSVGKHWRVVMGWAQRKDPIARFAWIDRTGTVVYTNPL
jgi:hypothetical protein